MIKITRLWRNVDEQKINVVSLGLCAITRVCILAGTKLNWINTVPKVTVLGNKPLLDKKSKLIYPKGGVISCLMSGQLF